MGCAGSKTENPNKSADSKVKGSAAPPASLPSSDPASAAKPQPAKLTHQQIEDRRESMRKNLQEGHANPPSFQPPHLAIALNSQ